MRTAADFAAREAVAYCLDRGRLGCGVRGSDGMFFTLFAGSSVYSYFSRWQRQDPVGILEGAVWMSEVLVHLENQIVSVETTISEQ